MTEHLNSSPAFGEHEARDLVDEFVQTGRQLLSTLTGRPLGPDDLVAFLRLAIVSEKFVGHFSPILLCSLSHRNRTKTLRLLSHRIQRRK